MEKRNPKKTEVYFATAMLRNDKKLEQLYEKSRIIAVTDEEMSMKNVAYLSGLNRVRVTEEKLANPLFKKSYERGLRFRYLYEYKQKAKIVEKMVSDNIDFDLASDEIKKDPTLYNYYLVCKMKKDLEQIRSYKKVK